MATVPVTMSTLMMTAMVGVMLMNKLVNVRNGAKEYLQRQALIMLMDSILVTVQELYSYQMIMTIPIKHLDWTILGSN